MSVSYASANRKRRDRIGEVMAEKLVCDDYKIDDVLFQISTETGLRGNNFTVLFGGVEQELDQFTPQQVQAIANYVADWRAPGGH